MSLSEDQKTKLINASLAARKTSVDGLMTEKRSVSEYRELVELANDLDASKSPAERIHIGSIIPPGALDG